MILIKSFTNLLLLSAILLFAGCVNSSKKEEVKTDPGIVNRLLATNITPADFPAKVQSIITLQYSSVDNDVASSCALSSVSGVSVTQSCSCAQGICMVGVTAPYYYTGAGSFSFNVTAAGKTSTTGKATFNVLAPLAGSNIAPTISTIAAATTTEGAAVSASFTVGDEDSAISCSNVTVASSNTTLIPNANVVVSGSGGNCVVTVTSVMNQTGLSNITLTLTDTGTPLPAKTAVSTFAVTVTAFNDPPTISSVSGKTTLEDTPITNIGFTIGDVDSSLSCSNVTASSSNTVLVANANITIGGTAPNCTVALSPTLNQSGTTTISLTVHDNGTPMPSKSTTTSFSLVVAAVNDAPVIATIPAQTGTENVSKAVNFTITDVDSNLTCNGSVAVTSSNTTLVPNTNITLTGIAPNCTATITPASNQYGTTTLTVTVSDNGFPMPIMSATTSFNLQIAKVNRAPTISAIGNQTTNEDTPKGGITFTISDSDSTVFCSNVTGTSSNTSIVANSSIVVTGTAPNCVATINPAANAYGSVNITLTISDNGTPMPAMTATSVFSLAIAAVNDVPIISSVANQSIGEGTPSSPIALTITDVDSSLSCASSVTASSSNATLIPNANIVFSGTAPNCTMVITSASGLDGTATITLTLTDSGNPAPVKTATTSFSVNVTQVNDPPAISVIAGQTTNEDTALSGIAFTITDSDSSVYCANVVGTSSNTAIVPNENIIITGSAPNCFAAVSPLLNASGSVMITLTLTDNGSPLPAKTATSAFALAIEAVNDAPTISSITNKSIEEDNPTSAISFTVSDVDSTLTCNGSVAGTSSNTAVVSNSGIAIAGTIPNCSVVITPEAGQSGSTTITLTVTDNGTPMPALFVTTTFDVNVSPVPDLSGTLSLANNISGIGSSYAANTYAKILHLTGLSVDEVPESVEVCLGTSSGSCDVSTWVEATGFSQTGSVPNISIDGAYRMKSAQGGAQSFSLTPSCGSTHNYYYSVRVTNSSSKVSNAISTPAWTFWEPSCLGTLAQWLDAMEASTVSFASGSSVATWTDKSSNARSVSGLSGKYPTYTSSELGAGYPGMKFDGSSQVFTRNSFVYALGSTSIFTVIKSAASAGKAVFSEGGAMGSEVSYTPLMSSASNTMTGLIVNGSDVTELDLPVTSSPLFDGSVRLAMVQDSGSSYVTYSNGIRQDEAATSYTRGVSSPTTFHLGARYKNGDDSLWMPGAIGEFIVTSGVLSSLNRQKLEGYSAHKWGVSSNLPAGHPYKSAAP